MSDSAPGTFRAYEITLTAWERHTKNPRLETITLRTLAEFKASLAAADSQSSATAGKRRAKPPSPATINKHLRHVHHLLAKAGPPGPGNRDALGVIKTSPWTKPLREHEREIRVVADDELARFFVAAGRARLPELDGVEPPTWWRSLAAAAVLLAARRGTLLGLRWSHIDLAARRVSYGGEIDKCGRRRSKPLHELLVRHLVAVRGPWDLVFPWPHCESTWYREFRRIVGVAGDAWSLHDLKRTGATIGSQVMDLLTLKEFCDHTSVRTTERHYATGRGRLAAAVDQLQVPKAFHLAAGDDRQRRLF